MVDMSRVHKFGLIKLMNMVEVTEENIWEHDRYNNEIINHRVVGVFDKLLNTLRSYTNDWIHVFGAIQADQAEQRVDEQTAKIELIIQEINKKDPKLLAEVVSKLTER